MIKDAVPLSRLNMSLDENIHSGVDTKDDKELFYRISCLTAISIVFSGLDGYSSQ